MSLVCPVCNGLEALTARCPHCAETMMDEGRIGDYYGPYAPYRSIDDLKLTNGFVDLAFGHCVHYMHCPVCGYSNPQPVQEWKA